MDKKLRLTGYVGVAGSLLMYTGDMLLYFTTQPIPIGKRSAAFYGHSALGASHCRRDNRPVGGGSVHHRILPFVSQG